MSYLASQNSFNMKASRFLLMAIALSLVGGCVCGLSTVKDEIKSTTSTQATTAFSQKNASVRLLESTVAPSVATLTTKGYRKTTKALMTSERPLISLYSTTKVYASTKAVAKSARRQKLNTSSSGAASAAHSAGLQERLAALDCNLPVLPSASRLWRGNETHELNLPVKCDFVVRMAEECADRGSGGAGPEEECAPDIVSWEGSTDIQSGDILIVRIADSLLLDTPSQLDPRNSSELNSSHIGESSHHLLQPAVYQVTRQGHEHCDLSDGMLLDITPLDEHGAKLFTLYDKDLTEGVNLLIVVSENWGSKCVRLKVTVKSDNCGDYQDCSGKGVCYTNVSMEGYECQCCPGSMGPHCEERDPCYPSPCLNNGSCVELPQSVNGDNYRCLCPFGYVGKHCEKDPCSLAPCMNGGSCMSISMNGTTSFHCACSQGWAGTRCELSIAAGACASNPCEKGICIEQLDNDIEGKEYRCFCEPGYTGERCELEYNECESSPCEHGGTCSDRVAGFECVCARGYTGNTCQLKVDLCSPNPCPEQQFCVDRGNNYDCQCPHGFVGEECHIPTRSPCDASPCAHGGTCWSDVDTFYCSCRPGYTGKLCEEDFILESVVGGEADMEERRGGGSVRETRLPLGLYHDRLHNVYIAAGTLGAAIAIVGVVVTACHCRVNKTYSRLLSRLSRVTEAGPPHHWLQDKRAPPSAAPFPPPSTTLDTTDMYYTLDFSDSQSSPLIQ